MVKDRDMSGAEQEKPNGSAATEPASADGPEGDVRVEALETEIASLTDRHMRLAAEFDNYRKRTERERMDLYPRAQGDVVRRLLEAIDDLERVGDYIDAPADVLLEGVQLVEKKLLQSLSGAGLEAIDPVGDMFDPESMEAIGVVATASAGEDGRVADVYQKGYRFAGHLIRPARVRVHQHEG